MEKYSIEGTPKTPTITFDLNTGVLQINGRSIPEDTIGFYEPLFEALDKYATSPQPTTTLDIHLEYYNTSSSRCIFGVFRKLEEINKVGSKVSINWHYEESDDDMLEAGEDYQSIVDLPFKMIKESE